MTKLCICKICTCGRHKCPHNPTGQPRSSEPCTFSEYTNQYLQHPLEATKSFKPEAKAHQSDGPMDDMTTHKFDYIPHALAERVPHKQEKYVQPEGQMDMMTNYSKEYTQKPFEPSRPARPIEARKNNGKFEGEPTYVADYKEWEMQPRERAKPDPNPYRPPDLPFDASTNYQNEFLPKRIEPRRNMKPIESTVLPDQPFDGDTHYRQDYIPHALAVKEVREKQVWKPNEAPLDDLSHYKKDFTPKFAEKTANFAPDVNPYKSEAPFDSETTQKMDYLPWAVEKREQREKEVYRKPEGDFNHFTTTQVDYIPKQLERPTFRKPPEARRSAGKFDDTTNYKSEYLQWKPSSANRPLQRPKEEYQPNDAPFEGLPTYQSDYVKYDGVAPVRSLKPAHSDYSLNKGGPMDDATEYKKEFYKKEAAICPATYLTSGKYTPYKYDHSDDDGHKWFEMPAMHMGGSVVGAR